MRSASAVAVTAVVAALCFVAAAAFLAPFANAAAPMFPHIALTHNTSHVYISFFTNTTMRGTPSAKWGTRSEGYTSSATGTSSTYDAATGYCHDVLVTGLAPKVRYYYRVGSEADGWTPEYSFLLKDDSSKPTAADPVVIPIFGDMGILHSAETIAALAAIGNEVDFYYHVGDISYANDRPSELYETVWSAWFQNMTKIMPYYPYMVLPGNHEARSGRPFLKWSEGFKVYNKRFVMPGGGEKENMWYSFDYKNIHFISISTETDFEGCEFPEFKFGDQLRWLERDLAIANTPANRQARPWIIVSGHKPIYTSATHAATWAKAIQRSFEEMLHKYKVDLFFCGHVHAYERTYPVHKDKATAKDYNDPKGLTVITTGASGDIEGISRKWEDPRPEWSAFIYDKETAYGVLTVENDFRAHWRFYESEGRRMVDEFVLDKKPRA